jgi:hypothetical protein
MAIQSYFFNAVLNDGEYDRTYNAEDVTSYLDLLVGNGVFPNPSTMLQVRASSGMTVIVGAGAGWINGHKMINTADMTLTLNASDVLLDRIDDVIFFVDFNQRTMGIEVKEGTVAATPVAPTLQRDDSRYEMCLAQIQVNKQITEITAAMITDTRGNSDLCGYVQGLIQQADTTTLFESWQNGFETWFEAVQSQFEQGKIFKRLEGQVTTTQPNQAVFNVLTYIPTYAFAYDTLDVYINGIHLNGNEYSQSNAVITLETPIQKAGAVVTFVVYKSVDQ